MLRDFLQVLFFALVIRPFVTLFIGLRVRDRERIPSRDPFVLVANHSSHLDTITLLSLFPLRRLRRIRPVAAADYFERNALVSWFSRTFFNILPIARRRADLAESNPIDLMAEALKRGESLIVFPEGTRGRGNALGKFHSGVARVMERSPGVPVLPAWLVNMGRSLPKGEWFPLPFFCEVRIGEAMLLEGEREERTAQIESAVRRLGGLPEETITPT